MSFSHRIKTEICNNRPFRQRSKKALTYGLLLFGQSFGTGQIALHTEHRVVAKLYADCISDLVRLEEGITVREIRRGERRSVFIATIDSERDCEAVLSVFKSAGPDWDRQIDAGLLTEKDYPAFISGAFLACGGVSDPEKSYRAEFSFARQKLCGELSLLLAERLSVPKQTVRRNSYLLYYQESEPIEELLTYIGAPKSALELMEIKMIKELRNKVNRTTNCETANISKTIDASIGQTEDIRLIEASGGLGTLPEDLQEIALLRREQPELSLRELGIALREPLSRSGVNHRLRRIGAFAQQLREQQNGGKK